MSDNKEEEKTKFVVVNLGLNIQMRKNIDQTKKNTESKDTKIEMKTEKQPVSVKEKDKNESEKTICKEK